MSRIRMVCMASDARWTAWLTSRQEGYGRLVSRMGWIAMVASAAMACFVR